MGKKAVKRPIEASSATEINKQSPKKQKVNGDADPQKSKKPLNNVKKVQPTKKAVANKTTDAKKTTVDEKVEPQNIEKSNEVKTTVEKKPVENATNAPAEKTNNKKLGQKLTPDEVIQRKKERLLKKKQKQLEKKSKELAEKNENRKLKRQSEGQYKIDQIELCEADIDKKIAEIESRPELTKTARRRLAVLKKKKTILDGSFAAKIAKTPITLTATEKRKLRKQKLKLKNQLSKEGGDDAVNESADVKKTKPAELKKQKSKVEKTPENKDTTEDDKVESTVATPNDNAKKNTKAAKKVKAAEIKPEEPKLENKAEGKEDPDDDDDDDDDSEDEEEATEAESTLNTSADVTMDQDDDEDEDDEEELNESSADVSMKEEEEKPKAKKQQNAQKASNPPKGPQTPKKSRFVLFVGNLPYTTTTDDLKNHFLTKVSEVQCVRLPTKPDNSPKGIGFVEFTNSTDYEKGLSLHNTILNGRKINVQYTEGGSKKAGNRPHVVDKNKKLHALRKQGKLAGSTPDSQKRNARRNKKASA